MQQNATSGFDRNTTRPEEANLGGHTLKPQRERKTIHIDLKENHRGRFIRIKERAGKTSSVIIPIECLDEAIQALEDLRQTHSTSAPGTH